MVSVFGLDCSGAALYWLLQFFGIHGLRSALISSSSLVVIGWTSHCCGGLLLIVRLSLPTPTPLFPAKAVFEKFSLGAATARSRIAAQSFTLTPIGQNPVANA